MTELDKLEAYLKEHGADYERTDNDGQTAAIDEYGHFIYREVHQIKVYENRRYSWDAICHPWSYGYEEGLLEIMGEICRVKNDVEGYLTAENVIERIENG